jgi:hypothetical protein
MKAKYKHVEFTRDETKVLFYDDGAQPWQCHNHKGVLLGSCEYGERWSQWEFEPEALMGFSASCLRDIAHFLEQLNK